MQTGKKKPALPWLLAGAVLAGYLGYMLGGIWKEGITYVEFMERLSAVCERPLANYWSAYSLKLIAFAELIYAMAMLMYYTSGRNLMPGKEHGTARLEPPAQAARLLEDKDPERNRILSKNVRMSMDFRKLKLNGNILICGGSGAGKTFYFVKPNLMQLPRNCSFICTDPKGEILRSCGQMLKDNGYQVKVINLLEMEKSDCYNPFRYIREETDVVKLITNLIANTTPKGANSSDPFWEKAESMLLQALFYYVWLEESDATKNMGTVMKLLGEAEVTERNKPSKLDLRMQKLAERSKLGEQHPAIVQYNKCMRGAGDTVRSIIISANSRLAYLENQKVLRLLSRDDMNLAELGTGVNRDEKTRTALFCVIPDSDKSYNFIIGMLYTQIFQELYYHAVVAIETAQRNRRGYWDCQIGRCGKAHRLISQKYNATPCQQAEGRKKELLYCQPPYYRFLIFFNVFIHLNHQCFFLLLSHRPSALLVSTCAPFTLPTVSATVKVISHR